ncbi:MAG: alpha/beta fold hydrolase [Hyphomicrobiales bacterium]
MTTPSTRWLDLPAGRFRVLEWPGAGPPVLFLHGLTGVAEVWGPTVSALAPTPRAFALDQRGHGHSPKPASGYTALAFANDAIAAVRALGLDRPHLVGHSMGGRVAIVAAARHPALFRSVAIVDIGPEQWRENWESTVTALDLVPESYPDAERAIGRAASRGRESRGAEPGRPGPGELRAIALARLRTLPNGHLAWLADREALKQAVRLQRSRNYWGEWQALSIPALLVRGGESRELRATVAAGMRRRNPNVRFAELDGVGHNIPLLAPGRLASLLTGFWQSLD